MSKIILQSALATAVFLVGGLLAGMVFGNDVYNFLPGHSLVNPSALHVVIAALPTLAGVAIGAGLWGMWMQRLTTSTNRRRMAWAGVLGYAPVTVLLAITLARIEPFVVETLSAQFPIHRIFTFLFVPSAFLIAGVSALCIGIGLADRRLALSLFWRVGLAAAASFLVVNLVMEAAGWRVGGPNAAARFTMLAVMFLGNLAAAFVGGAVMGWLLSVQQSNRM